MSKKEELNKEDLDFLKNLLGESKKEAIRAPVIKELRELKKEISVSSIKDKSKRLGRLGNVESELEKINLAYSLALENIEKEKSSIKRRKIKKKQLFLEIAEALPLIKENNLLLNKLIQQIEISLKALTQKF